MVAKVEFHFGELFPRFGLIVTNLVMDSRAVGPFYNQRGHGGAVDQRRQTGGKDNTSVLSSFSVERSATLAECDRLQPGQPVAALGAAQQNR